MQSNIQLISIVIIVYCGIIIAKNPETSEKIDNDIKNKSSSNSSILKVNSSEIFSEGGGGSNKQTIKLEVENAEEPKKSKVKGRKGVSFEDMKTSSEDSNSNSTTNVTVQQTKSSNSSSNEILKNVTNNSSSKINETLPITPSTNLNVSIPSTSTTATTTTKLKPTSTTSIFKPIITTTKKTIHKPLITYSIDEYDAIKESEKNINYRIGKEKSLDDSPKIEQDVDRAVLEEKQARKNYFIYLVLAVAVPLTFVAINLTYKRVKNYLELREYTRVDFLVDGMYVN